MDSNLMAQSKAIKLLEMLSQSMQVLLTVASKGPVRDKAVGRLAAIDQNIAKYKDHLGILGEDNCEYLNN